MERHLGRESENETRMGEGHAGQGCSFPVMGEKGVCRYPAVYTARRTVEWAHSWPLFSMRSGYLLKPIYVGIFTDYT